MDYDFRYELSSAPESRADGTALVSHDVWGVARESGTQDAFSKRAGLPHATILILADDLLTVMAMPDGTGPQKTAKNAAYKDLLVANVGNSATPVTGWASGVMETILDANDKSADAAAQAADYITVTLDQEFPVQFTI